MGEELLEIDIERGCKSFEPGDGELAGSGFESADGDSSCRRVAAGGDVGEGEAPGLADFAQTADHVGISGKSCGYTVSYRRTNMAK